MRVTVSTDLPIAAEAACALACRATTLRYVLAPWLDLVPVGEVPDAVREGDEVSVRLRFLGVLPAWTHTLRVERLGEREIVSSEHGGPVTAWNHRLTFEPTSAASCRYTDRVNVRAGLLTPVVALFAHAIYRWRQARWRRLARVLA